MITVIVLGIIQGLTEFLPISSSGHLVLVGNWMNTRGDDLLFELLLHTGTLAATALVFHKQIGEILSGLIRKESKAVKITTYIIITTFVTALLGKLGEDFFEQNFQSSAIVCIMLLITGAILYLPKFIKPATVKMEKMGWKKAVVLGLFQTMAIIPGISRSGTTITTALLCGLNRKDAGDYAFLISIPIILGASIVKLPALGDAQPHFTGLQMAVGVFTSFLVGWAALKFLLMFVKKGKLHVFSWYCWIIGILGLLFLR